MYIAYCVNVKYYIHAIFELDYVNIYMHIRLDWQVNITQRAIDDHTPFKNCSNICSCKQQHTLQSLWRNVFIFKLTVMFLDLSLEWSDNP